MKFNNLIYERPNMEEFEERITVLLENFRTADNFIEQSELIDQINTLRNDVLTMLTIAQIDEAKAWEMYMKICELGGSKSFLQLLDISGIASPFDERGFSSIVDVIEEWLKKQ